MAGRRARDLTTRVALYWAPELTDPLHAAGSSWLGYDAELAAETAPPALDGLAALTAGARLYGFHATLRPPMRLATGWEEFIGAAHAVAARCEPFEMPPLEVADLGGFLALRERAPCPRLQALADACVVETEPHRLRAGAEELARRRAAGLSSVQEAMLLRWGYPHVLGEWRFHMTLSRRLSADEMVWWRPLAAAHFAAALTVPRQVTAVCVFTQRNGGAFRIAERIAFKASGPF